MLRIILFFLLPVLLKAQPGRIELVSISSPELGITKQFNIYLPAGYDSSDVSYPVLYLFRGHENEWADPFEDGSRGGRNAKTLADRLIETREMGPMILVMPGMSSADNSQPALAVDFLQPELVGGLAGIGSGRFERYLMNDLIPFVDSTFRTLPARHLRGVDGFSLGGITSMMIAGRHPEDFISAGAYDGTLMWLDFDDPAIPGTNDDFWLYWTAAHPLFGWPRDLNYILEYNPANLIMYADSSERILFNSMQFLLHSVGSPTLGNYPQTQQLVNILGQTGNHNNLNSIALNPDAEHNWWWADEHMLITMPLHWQRFMQQDTSDNTTSLVLNNPSAGNTYAGVISVEWQSGANTDSASVLLAWTKDDGFSWHKIAKVPALQSSFNWSTLNIADGTRYRLRLWLDGQGQSAVTGSGAFTINNPGNGKPDIVLQTPAAGETVDGNYLLRWQAADADGDSLVYSAQISSDEGQTWQVLFTDVQDVRSYLWQTADFANGDSYRIKVFANDGLSISSDSSGIFSVFNRRIAVADSLLTHISGISTARISLNIVDVTALTGDYYRMTVDDSSTQQKSYSVENMTRGTTVVNESTRLDGVTEGPQFDGLRLVVGDFVSPQVNTLQTGWRYGSPEVEVSVYLPDIDLGPDTLVGIAWPADYRITITGGISDTSENEFGVPAIPTFFKIENLTEAKPAPFIFSDFDGDQHLSLFDDLFLLEYDDRQLPFLVWALHAGGESGAADPQPGDVFELHIDKPLTSADVYEFGGITGLKTDNHTPKSLTLEQNFPNPFNPLTTIRFFIDKRQNLKLEIFDVTGRKIRSLIDKVVPAGSGTIQWNGKNDSGKSVSSGIYLYRLTAGGRSLAGKMILLR